MDTSTLGHDGELFVAKLLEKKGFTIHQKNYRKFFGEIDIIAYKKNLYIFVEVKTRKSDRMAMGQLISLSKQQKIIKTARTFIAQHHITNAIFRFDVALLVQQDSSFAVQYIENAFTQQDQGHDEYC